MTLFNPFLLGLFMLVIGIDEFQKGRKSYGYMSIAVSLFAFFVSLQAFFLN
ncbi:YczI family protein [Virgibacillus byunsanensis]|uniref:YczI family protein n=1 Tax=Virgibacillus byunsanensis TaxID=570945 RepID=A0ABW3LNT9_9BACI